MTLRTVFRKMTNRLFTGTVLFFMAFFGVHLQLHAQAPGLYINEVSQGASGAKEYVELLVVGTPSCFSIPTLDLRGWYIDDNNGFHATGGGTGIAQGCLRLTQDPLWSAVPIGTLIVVYNDADLNANIPAQDLSLSDGNCRLVIPVSNCTLIEKNSSLPSAAVATYPTTGFSSCGSWTVVGMANTDDSFQTIDPSGNLFHSVSWGNNTLSPIIYFAGSSAGMVARMTNATSNNISLQANWTRVAVAGNETPGAPNNAANQAWICSMNNGCTVVNPLTLAASQTNASCSCTGTAMVTPSGGFNGCSAGYTYSWAPSGGNAASASALCGGNYTVTVSDVNGCTATHSFAITSTASFTLNTTQNNVTCFGGTNGSASVTVTGGTGPFTYAWSPSGGNAANASGLSAGTYTVSVTDASLCTGTAVVTITQPSAVTISASQSNVNCNGACNGSATVSASGGSGTYTYAWSPSGGTGATASSLCAGTYTCTITSAPGCTTTQSFSITQPTAVSVAASQVNVNCNGACNGSATVNASGGSGTYTYAWSPSGGTGATASALCSGTYTCTITSAPGCTATQSFAITQPTAVAVTTSQVNVNCNSSCNGSATVNASGGSGTYTYAWTPNGGTNATASSLCAGTYSCTITSAPGCTTVESFTITQPAAVAVTSSQVNANCNGACNGSATVNASGGTGTYTYAWLPAGGTNATASSLCAGTYTCTITSAPGCTTTQSFSITQPPVLTASASVTNVSCNGGNNGSATASVSGGTAAYSYAWSSGGNAATVSALTAGNYTCTITDAHGCTTTTSVSITAPPALSISGFQTNILCNGASTGDITAAPSGGVPSYSYAWSNSATSPTISNLPAGSYTCTITDANNCTLQQVFTLTQPNAISISTSSTPATCNNANGTLSATASGGTGTFTYLWTPGNFSSANVSNVAAGNYALAVTDQNGCTSSATVTVGNSGAPTLAVVSSTNVSCNGGSDGAATMNGSGGTGPLVYAWSPSGGTNATASNLSASTYTCTVTDANGCFATQTISITQPNAITATVTTTNVSCNSGSDGNASLAVTGGTGAYSYAWSPAGGTNAAANNLPAGNYSCTITDANGCTFSQSVIITEPAALAASISGTDATCFGNSNATAAVIANGGTGALSYAWTPSGGGNPNATNLSAGNYTCTITDANGCTLTQSIALTQPPAISITTSFTNAHCNLSDGSATASANGGTGTFTYSWLPSGGGASITNIASGNYTVIVTDQNSCSDSATVVVNALPGVTASVATTTNISCFGSSDGSISINAVNGNPAYTYSWTPNVSTSSNANALPAGNYQVVVGDADGCTSTVTVNLVQPSPLIVGLNTVAQSICPGQSLQLSAAPSGGTAAYSVTWNPGNLSGNPVITPAAGATYSVTVTDAHGCTANDSVQIGVYPAPLAQFTSDVQQGCAPVCVSFTDASAVNAPAVVTSWIWDFGDGNTSSQQQASHCYSTPGSYNVSLSVTTSNGCKDSVQLNAAVQVFALPVAVFSWSPQPVTIFAPTVSFTDQSTGAASWQWSFGDVAHSSSNLQDPSFTYPEPTCYSAQLIVTSANGCTDTTMQEICVEPEVELYVPNAFTPNGDGRNDFFLPVGEGIDWNTFHMMIFDRWGNLLYETSDIGKPWDGRANGGADLAQTDVYVWKIDVRDINGGPHYLSGHVSLVR